jgi:hypothetical protein
MGPQEQPYDEELEVEELLDGDDRPAYLDEDEYDFDPV